MNTTITRSQKLQKQINEFLYPDKLDRLKKGCQIICKYNGLVTLTKDAERHEQSEFYYCYGFDDAVGSPRISKGNEILDVLGKPIEFTDLCLFISQTQKYKKIHTLSFRENKVSGFAIEFRTLLRNEAFRLVWLYSKDFHHQNEYFYDALEEVNLKIV